MELQLYGPFTNGVSSEGEKGGGGGAAYKIDINHDALKGWDGGKKSQMKKNYYRDLGHLSLD